MPVLRGKEYKMSKLAEKMARMSAESLAGFEDEEAERADMNAVSGAGTENDPSDPVTDEAPGGQRAASPDTPANGAHTRRPVSVPVPGEDDPDGRPSVRERISSKIAQRSALEGQAPWEEAADNPAVVDPPSGSESEATSTDPAIPDGVTREATGMTRTEEERVQEMISGRNLNSVEKGPSGESLMDGSVKTWDASSKRQLQQYRKMRMAGLDIERPHPWPDSMDFPSDEELRALKQPGVTQDQIRAFEQRKQEQAELMAVRARQLSSWIFDVGHMRYNERAQMQRSARNWDAEANRRTDAVVDIESGDTRARDAVNPDPFQGIKFASLLNPDPSHLQMMQKMPVAAWGHDVVAMQDGGKVVASDGGMRVKKISVQAAQMIVMEAKERGWDSLTVRGDSEFCAAVESAAKEMGMGAVIYNKGGTGIWPAGRPKIIMPKLPATPIPDGHTPPEQVEKSAAAPSRDRARADGLDPDGAAVPEGGSGSKRSRQPVHVEDPLADSPTDDEPGRSRGDAPGADI